jgi:ABC-type nitrate/sulfonate/bicarbonate transport system permease component
MTWKHGILSALVLVSAWQLLVLVTGIQSFILPPPLKVAKALWFYRDIILENAQITII